jgi:hypothetical protein
VLHAAQNTVMSNWFKASELSVREMLNLVSFGNLHKFSKDGKFAQCRPFTFGSKTFQTGGPIDSLERWRSSFPGVDLIVPFLLLLSTLFY